MYIYIYIMISYYYATYILLWGFLREVCNPNVSLLLAGSSSHNNALLFDFYELSIPSDICVGIQDQHWFQWQLNHNTTLFVQEN